MVAEGLRSSPRPQTRAGALKLTFITNACALYEQDGYRLLSDPWLVPGAFGTWVHDPPLRTKPEDVATVDALYISHIHPDHLCEKTLQVFPRDVPIVTLKDRLSLAFKKLKELGFVNVQAIEDKESVEFGPFRLTIFGPFAKHPHHEEACELGNIVDSALLIEAGGVKVLNSNDNTPSLEAASWLSQDYGPFDLAQLNWNNAGPYPACFDNLSHDEKLAEASRCLVRNLRHMRDVARLLGARRTMPFAGTYKLGYGLEHLNQYLGACSAADAAAYLMKHGIVPEWLREGESVDLG